MRLLALAALAAAIHAAFSLYRALGGRWLLDAVGQGAVDLADDHPVSAGLALGAIALAKLAGGAVPHLVEIGRVPGRRGWRRLEAVGAGLWFTRTARVRDEPATNG